MANEEHLAILKKGVNSWNEWRKLNRSVGPQLCDAELVGMNLCGADFSEANLPRANLTRAVLDGANLTKASLAGANLAGASLEGTDLYASNLAGAIVTNVRFTRSKLFGANFYGADLTGASFLETNLSGACLTQANLCAASLVNSQLFGTDFREANLRSTVFGNLDLESATGLKMANHYGPSTIGVDTIFLSRGQIPDMFLRGAGVPEAFIAYMKSLVVKPIEYYSCFISYSSKDEEFVRKLHLDLQGEQVRCWFAPEDLKIGDEIRPRIDEAIRIHDKLLIVLSENSVGSPWVRKEVETAFGKEIKFEAEQKQRRTVLFPIRLDDAVMKTEEAWAADIKRTRHIGDFREWRNHDKYKEAFGRLLRDLKAEEKGPG